MYIEIDICISGRKGAPSRTRDLVDPPGRVHGLGLVRLGKLRLC